VWEKFKAFYAAEPGSAADWSRRWRLWVLRERESYRGSETRHSKRHRAPGGFLAPATDINAAYEVIHEI